MPCPRAGGARPNPQRSDRRAERPVGIENIGQHMLATGLQQVGAWTTIGNGLLQQLQELLAMVDIIGQPGRGSSGVVCAGALGIDQPNFFHVEQFSIPD